MLEKIDYKLINECLIGRQVELRGHIKFLKSQCEIFEIEIDNFKDKLVEYENEIAKIEKVLNKIKQIGINLYYQN